MATKSHARQQKEPAFAWYWRRVLLLVISMMMCTLTTEGELQDKVEDTATSFGWKYTDNTVS
jgi:hypothetical protein